MVTEFEIASIINDDHTMDAYIKGNAFEALTQIIHNSLDASATCSLQVDRPLDAIEIPQKVKLNSKTFIIPSIEIKSIISFHPKQIYSIHLFSDIFGYIESFCTIKLIMQLLY